jgi:tetratricopeptide (TPR) repeat protein
VEVGTVVGSRYTIDAVAGAGGMCSVYRAHDRDGSRVAIKALHPHALEAGERFAREAHMLQDLRHPAVVRYLDSGTTADGLPYLVMEWLDGTDLEALLRARSLSLVEVLALAQRIARALGAAHARGIVHRDVKPSNIFVVGGDVEAAKLLDFGVARWGGGGRTLTVTGTSVGTPAYMAPEQVRGERAVDARADVFALGCVVYECLTGEPAFVAHSPMAVFCKILVDGAPRAAESVPGLPESVDDLLGRMLAKEPDDRPRDGLALAALLEAVAADVEDSGHRPPLGRARKTITSDEQRLVNVIVAGGAKPSGDARTLRLFPAAVPKVDVLPGKAASVRYDALSDGTLVALLDARGVATDQAVRAARLALALRDELAGGHLALATGLAVVNKNRLVGEAIDRACGMLTAATGGVRIDEVTAGLIGARFDVIHDPAGSLLLAERPAPAERTLLGKPTPFANRTRELAVLRSTLDECVEGGVARAVLVTGTPGSGKSRLLREMIRGLESRDVAVWLGAGDPVRSGSLAMLAEVARRLAGVLDGEPAPIRRQKLRALTARHFAGADAVRVAEFLGELIHVPPGDDDSPPLRAARADAILMGDQVRRALEDLLDAQARARPVLLVLEDLHWGDAATIGFIDRALRNLAERPLMVVALARPELHDEFPRLWSAHNLTELRLGPLPRRAAQTLAEAVLGDQVPAKRVAEIVERADGNPFYLEELVRSAAGGAFTLPETVLAMVQARLDALEPEARRILRAASVFGGQFWRGAVAALTGVGAALDDWLDALEQRELITRADDSRFSGERAYRFRHDLVREAAYALLIADDRRLGHLLAAEWLEKAGDSDARALGEHFDQGGARARALPCYLRAAETALERGDFAAVLDLTERADRCGPGSDQLGVLRALQGDARYWRGEYAHAERLYVDAMVLLARGGRRWYQVVGKLTIVWGATDATDHMETLARSLVADDDPGDDRPARLVALAVVSSRLFLCGRRLLARQLLADAEADAGDLERADATLAAQVHRARAARGLTDGDPATFLGETERSVDRFEEIGDAREACLQRANAGYALLELGRYAEAELDLRATLAVAERMGLDHVAQAIRSNLGMVLARRGQLRDARALEERAAAWFEKRDRRLAGAAHMYRSMILLAEGELGEAEDAARLSLDLLTGEIQAQALAHLARVLLARGAIGEALERALEAERRLAEGVVYEGEALVHLMRAEALRAAGETDAATASVARARDRLLERAARIGHPEWRRSFLEEIPDHARTFELARSWAGGG